MGVGVELCWPYRAQEELFETTAVFKLMSVSLGLFDGVYSFSCFPDR
jgi:hypothetical protein